MVLRDVGIVDSDASLRRAWDSGAFYTLVPIRPRWRGERRSLRTFAVVSLRPQHAFNPRHRRLSTSTDAFQLHPDIRSYRTALDDDDDDDDAAAPKPPPRATAFVSYPRTGKHVAFDGRWLHGAPEALSAKNMSDGKVGGVGKWRTVSDKRRRTTFLVNVWLDHVPSTAAPLPDDALREVSKEPYDDDDDDDDAARAEEAPVDAYEVVEAGETTDEGEMTSLPAFVHAGRTHRASWRLPRRWTRGEGEGGVVDVVACGGGMGRSLAFATEGRVEEVEEEEEEEEEEPAS